MNAKLVQVFVFGFATGGIAGFVAANTIFAKKYQKIIDAEIADMKEYYNRLKTSEIEDTEDTELESDDRSTLEETPKMPAVVRTATPKPNAVEQAKIDYAKFSDQKPKAKPKPKAKKTEVMESEEEEPKVKGPQIIDPEEFFEGNDFFDKITLAYYSLDETLCTEEEDMIDDIDHTIGREAYKLLRSGAVRSMYVRNNDIECDYEIDVIRGSFKSLIDTPEIPKQKPRQGRPHDKENEK